jgi:hypothetical protein
MGIDFRFPVVDSNRVTGTLTCSYERLDDLLLRYKCLISLWVKIIHCRQYLCDSFPIEPLQSRHDDRLQDTRRVWTAVNVWKSSSHLYAIHVVLQSRFQQPKEKKLLDIKPFHSE